MLDKLPLSIIHRIVLEYLPQRHDARKLLFVLRNYREYIRKNRGLWTELYLRFSTPYVAAQNNRPQVLREMRRQWDARGTYWMWYIEATRGCIHGGHLSLLQQIIHPPQKSDYLLIDRMMNCAVTHEKWQILYWLLATYTKRLPSCVPYAALVEVHRTQTTESVVYKQVREILEDNGLAVAELEINGGS